MGRVVQEKPMKEFMYRESRVALALGDPARYEIVDVLMKAGPINVSELVKRVHRSQSTVSHHLAKLRSLEIVRYETKIDGVYYWIKYPQELSGVIQTLRAFIKRTSQDIGSDK